MGKRNATTERVGDRTRTRGLRLHQDVAQEAEHAAEQRQTADGEERPIKLHFRATEVDVADCAEPERTAVRRPAIVFWRFSLSTFLPVRSVT